MFDSRQFLQFIVDRKLGFDQDRDLSFDHDRDLLFNFDRQLSFDEDRDLGFGMHGPVFRGRACPNCKYLVHPLEETCRHCGMAVAGMSSVTPKATKKAVVRRAPGQQQICPNCSLKIPADAVYCPRCRVKLDEWRDYIVRLRQWEQEEAARKQAEAMAQAARSYQDDYYRTQRRR
jgi:RNA polymerase subunit RPABC4/transcription elongation factor Spt4